MTGKGIGLTIVLLVSCFGALIGVPNDRQTSSPLNTDSNIVAAGYPVETHHVTTEDGYILRMHRIPYGREGTVNTQPRTPVFMMHGLTGASNAWIALGADLAPAYNLADAGFDVWMGNARGNRESRFHVSLDPDDAEETYTFFDFTWHEIGVIDVPAMLDYILDTTGFEKLHYIGHSQGGTVFLVMNSIRPDYNEKIASAHLMAGVGYMEYFPDQQLAGFAALTNIIYALVLEIGLVELFPPGFNISDIPDFLPFPRNRYDCDVGFGARGICDFIGVQQLMLRNDEETTEEAIDLSNFGGAAVKQYAHYGQNVASQLFRPWDYGSATNLQVYGSEAPPLYDLSLITVNTTMHYTVADNLLDERDVLAMAAVMPNTVVRRVARDTFSHVDFVVAADARELVTDFIVDALLAFENEFTEVTGPPAETDSGSDGDGEEDENGGGDDNDDGNVIDADGNNSSSALGVGLLFNVYILVKMLLLAW